MKKIFPPLIFLLVITGLILSITYKKKNNNKITNHYTLIDFKDFHFLNPIQDYELNENSVICFFSSTCSLCSLEAKQLKKEEFVPENLDIIWVSSQPRDSIKRFIKSNQLSDVKHFKFAQIDSTLLEQKYDVKEYPRGLIYKNGILCHVYKGLISFLKIREKIKSVK